MSGLALVSFIGYASAPQAPVAAVVEEVKPPTVAELLTLVNAERARVGVAPLVIDERLNQSAQFKSDDMLKYNYFGHGSPNDGRRGNSYIKDFGVNCAKASENIYRRTPTVTAVGAFKWWKNSPPHYAAMIDANNDTTGFGIAGGNITQHFCQLR